MPNSIVLALMAILNHVPEMTAEGVKMWADVAHGEGGLQKVLTAVQDFEALVQTAISGSAPPPAAPAP